MTRIPTHEQRIKIYNKIKSHPASQNDMNQANLNHEQQQDRKISKEEVEKLLDRLTQDTRKDWVIKEQVDKIMAINVANHAKKQRDGRVEERLIKAGKEIEEKISRLREEEEKKTRETLQPAPKISQRAKNKIDAPFLQRIDDIVNQKEDLLRKLNNKHNPQFKPKLNPYSIFMAEVQNQKKFLDRVQQYQAQKKQSEMEKAKAIKQQEMRQATFKPQINSKSKSMAIRNSESGKSMSQPRESSQTLPYNFRPQINNRSRVLANARESSGMECHQRLYDEMRRISAKNMSRRRNNEQEHSHKPAINRKSLQIVKQKSRDNTKIEPSDEEQYEQVPFTIHDQLFRTDETDPQMDNQSCNEFLVQQVKYIEKYGQKGKQRISQIR